MTRDQEILSLTHRGSNLEADVERAEARLLESKNAKEDGESHKSQNDTLMRKIALLEGELDAAEKALRETTDK